MALKTKRPKTELKIGEWMPVLPILHSDDGRALAGDSYINGSNVRTGTITDGREWGRESERAYTVQAPQCWLGFFCIEPGRHPVNAHHLPGRPGLKWLEQHPSIHLDFTLKHPRL